MDHGRIASVFALALAAALLVDSAHAEPGTDTGSQSSVPVSDEPAQEYSAIDPDDAPPLAQLEEDAEASAAPVGDPAQTYKAAPASAVTGSASSTPPQSIPAALPTGADKSGVTSQAISVPKGAGTIQGMEESFSAQLSTGIATFSIPIALPRARGAAQPSLSLSYSSAGGFGVAGAGWSLSVPFIARQTDRGIPRYQDNPNWNPEQDRFVFNGGQELVPICTIAAGSCAAGLPQEAFPQWANGWQYFRPRVEGSFMRFFWSPDHQTWVVQDKSGVAMELGVPRDGTNDTQALEVNPDDPGEIYRWHLVRQFDAHGNANPAVGSPSPVNLVVYRYFQDAGMAYLSDIYDTLPAASPNASDLSTYAHHTHLRYEDRTDPTRSYRAGWLIEQRLRVTGIDVTSKTYNGGASQLRRQVRRYHLEYEAGQHVSLLSSVQVEGRCADSEDAAPAETNEALPPVTNCSTLPAMNLGYAHVEAFATDGSPGAADLSGYEGFDERIIPVATSPANSVDEQLSDLFDVNADGLPDVLVTAPGQFSGKHGVYFNGPDGTANAFGPAETIGVAGVGGDNASVLTLSNTNVNPLDVDGDGIADLLHMPAVKTYAVYSPVHTAQGWVWQGREVQLAAGLNPKVDFSTDAIDIRSMDVNFDGLVDLVVSTGTEYETFFALGRYPGGDGLFGKATWTGASSASASNAPQTACVPWSAMPVRFSDPDVKLGDMNGDGITDIVRVRKGDIRYWPGRGNGMWGTGKRDDCPAGTYGTNRYVLMDSGPQYSDIQGDSLLLDDVNGDGLSDLVQVRMTDVDVWLNVDGVGWTKRHVIAGTPAAPSFAKRVRLADLNGSGTRDIVWGDGGNYRYIDLQGGTRPWVLTHVENGLGKTTDIEYSTSTAEMLAAAKANAPWSRTMPTVVHVVKAVTDHDNVTIAGRPPSDQRTEYSYFDPAYDGQQREFRGFARARSVRVGDGNTPTDVTETRFLLGECVKEDPTDFGACTPPERWRDNPREALKGLPYLTERFDENGVVLSTQHTTYRLRQLYVGQDGRAVRHAFDQAEDSYLYDTSPFMPAAASAKETLTTVQLEATLGAAKVDTSTDVSLRSTAGLAHLRRRFDVDVFGNRTQAVAEGCVGGEACSAADEVITTLTDPGRPADDATGWIWRTVRSGVTGDAHPGLVRNEQFTTYNGAGDALKTTAKLSGTLGLHRFHAGGGAVAPAPATASGNDQVIDVSSRTYDTYGNLTQETSPNGRCRGVGYDADFQELATSETVYTGGGCGAGGLSMGAAYDRSFELATLVVDMQSQQTKVAYDQFGRLRMLTRPDPTTPGALSPQPSVKVEYFLPPDLGPGAAHSVIHTMSQDAKVLSDAEYLESWAYVDGMGRTLVTLQEADPSSDGGDAGGWVASALTEFDDKGSVRRKYLELFYDGDPKKFPFSVAPDSPYGRQSYDAFGRQQRTYDLDGTLTLRSAYHALATDMYDAADMSPGPHQGTYATERKDGHGRTVLTTERFHSGALIASRQTKTSYLPTNEPEVITRLHPGSSDAPVVRWLRYDSLGRMVLNAEPNTTKNFDPDPGADASTFEAWRYAYNDFGDLVGTSDARGCGTNFSYDGAGRLVSEDYSPCTSEQAPYSAPDVGSPSGPTGVEVLYLYDSAPAQPYPSLARPPGFGVLSQDFFKGRLVAVWDRASETWSNFDGRGRATESHVRIARPGAPSNALAERYAPRHYKKMMVFDAADREIAATTGATTAELQGTLEALTGTSSAVATTYTARGTLKQVAGSYGTLVGHVERAADGLLNTVEYGDVAKSTTGFSYDLRRRLKSVQTYRGPPPSWTNPPPDYLPAPSYGSDHLPTFQLLLQDDDFTYDVVSNPVEIRDWRVPDEWPDGAKPVTRKIQYDDLYRAARVDYQYSAGDDDWKSPFDAENSGNPSLDDPRRTKPTPHVSFDKRVQRQDFAYDWLGNTSATDDDTHGFYDRSLGEITNASDKPYQLSTAGNGSFGGTRTGTLRTAYDDAGNLTELRLERSGPCLPAGSQCSQIFAYDWDEVGRLVRARRWDVAQAEVGTAGDPLPALEPAVTLGYGYDAGDDRVLKSASTASGQDHFTAYIFDSLELRRALWTVASGAADDLDYELTPLTEVAYLFANGVRLARLAYEPPSSAVPDIGDAHLHVFFELGDHLGSSSVVLDQATSELVERSTYEAYGATESDYRPERWKAFREDYKFTGKEEDIDVGLTYFGKRYLSPYLNRWISADPMEVHRAGESNEPNVYAYVSGQVLKAIDPLGLAGDPAQPCGGMCRAAASKAMKLMDSRSLPTQFFKPQARKFGILPANYEGEGLYFRGRMSMKESSWRSLGPKVRGGLGALATYVHEDTHRSLPKLSRDFIDKGRAYLDTAHRDVIANKKTSLLLFHETVAYQVEHWAQTYMEFSEKIRTPERYGGLYELSKQYEARMEVEVRAKSYQTWTADGQVSAKLPGRVGFKGELRNQLLGEVFPGVTGKAGQDFSRMLMDPKMVELADKHFRWAEQQKANGWGQKQEPASK